MAMTHLSNRGIETNRGQETTQLETRVINIEYWKGEGTKLRWPHPHLPPRAGKDRRRTAMQERSLIEL